MPANQTSVCHHSCSCAFVCTPGLARCHGGVEGWHGPQRCRVCRLRCGERLSEPFWQGWTDGRTATVGVPMIKHAKSTRFCWQRRAKNREVKVCSLSLTHNTRTSSWLTSSRCFAAPMIRPNYLCCRCTDVTVHDKSAKAKNKNPTNKHQIKDCFFLYGH